VSIRPARPDELDAVIDLVMACDLHDFGASSGFELHVRDDWGQPGFGMWVADEPERGLVAFGLLWHRLPGQAFAWGWVHPERRGRGLGGALVDELERAAREHGDELVIQHTLPDAATGALFGGRGYEHVRSYLRMAVELDRAPEQPLYPPGIAVRPFRPGVDDRALYEAIDEAFADHWGHVSRPYAEWERRVAGADPALWLVALDGEELVGCVLCSPHMEDSGFVDTLAVRRPWRGRGLGRALLLAAFDVFWRQGRPRIELSVDSDSLTGATRLYESAGMRTVFSWDRRDKQLR
jgi:mycothiol synthase